MTDSSTIDCVATIEVVSSREDDCVVLRVIWDSGRVESVELESLDDVNEVLNALGIDATLIDGTTPDMRTLH